MTKRQRDVLTVLATPGFNGRAIPPNDIAALLGFRTGQDRNRHARDGRAMGPAQRVIFPLSALRKRGFVAMSPRTDGLSGTAYRITDAGRLALEEKTSC